MQDQDNNRRFSLGFIAGISVAVLAAGGAAAWWAIHSLTSSTKNSSAPARPQLSTPSRTDSSVPPIASANRTQGVKQPPPKPPGQTSKQETVQIYWFNASGGEIQLLPSQAAIQTKSALKGEVLESALKLVLEGPKDPEYTTTIPSGTKLLDLAVKKDGVHINLSQEFTTGGGSDSMIGRLKQIVYTATSLDPKGKVWIDVEGKPLEELGGEGIMVNQPTTRKDIEENF